MCASQGFGEVDQQVFGADAVDEGEQHGGWGIGAERGIWGWFNHCDAPDLSGAATDRRDAMGWQLYAGSRTGIRKPAYPKVSRAQPP